MARRAFPHRPGRLAVLLRWAVVEGRFEPDDERRVPFRRALSSARADANVLGELGELGVRTSPCGCRVRRGRPIVICGRHVFAERPGRRGRWS